MNPAITYTTLPAGSALHADLPGADFHDCLRLDLDPGDHSPIDVALLTLFRSPPWVNAAMGLRNRVAGLVGLKNLGHLNGFDPARPGASYRVGDRIGIFTLMAISEHEVVMGDSDKHLDVKVSVLKHREQGRGSVVMSTVVHIHNRLGRVYMALVGPMHKLIAPAVLARAIGGPLGQPGAGR